MLGVTKSLKCNTSVHKNQIFSASLRIELTCNALKNDHSNHNSVACLVQLMQYHLLPYSELLHQIAGFLPCKSSTHCVPKPAAKCNCKIKKKMDSGRMRNSPTFLLSLNI